jgi:hypothetical protein
VSLYQVQKFLFDLNRNPDVQELFRSDRTALLDRYTLTAEERLAIETQDIGLIYVLGANGQLLMHFAAFLGISWVDYLAAMRNGIDKFGPVRAGVYAMTTRIDEKVAGV